MIAAWNGLSTTTEAGVRTQVAGVSAVMLDVRARVEGYLEQVGRDFQVALEFMFRWMSSMAGFRRC